MLIYAVLSIAVHYSKIGNLPQITSMQPKSKKKTIAINSGLLAYTFTKLGDNLTNKDGDILNCKPKVDVKYEYIYSPAHADSNK